LDNVLEKEIGFIADEAADAEVNVSDIFLRMGPEENDGSNADLTIIRNQV
jgi:hypothetical protein